MKRQILGVVVAVACLGGAQMAGSAASSAAPRASGTGVVTATAVPANPGEYTWSDCIYESDLSDATFIESFLGGAVTLNCGSVRHIKSGHGFDNDTEGCIDNILNHQYNKVTSDTDPNNWVYSAVYSVGGNEYNQYYNGFVVTNKVSGNIVTAYTDTNTYAGNDSWDTCVGIAF